VLPPDVRTMDLGEARRIVGGGAGLDAEQRFVELDSFAAHIGGVMGATRVITDRGWVHHDRQIGTTGVVVDPALYISFGVSGAVQHVSGLGSPDHVISVNTDAHCPMMAMSDLAIVSDANATLGALIDALIEGLPDRQLAAGATGGGGPS
jgi:electron transfer flavoprotein alpha subunit